MTTGKGKRKGTRSLGRQKSLKLEQRKNIKNFQEKLRKIEHKRISKIAARRKQI